MLRTIEIRQEMPLQYAWRVAARVVELLGPYCDRIEIAGSIRRQCKVIHDVEIVCIPKSTEVPNDLFGGVKTVRDSRFCTTVAGWQKVIGSPAGRYTQRVLPDGSKLDLFTATPDNWGLIYAIRTGSARFSHHVLARGWSRLGYKSIDGMLHRINGPTHQPTPVPVRSEQELLDLLGLKWIHPIDRS